MSECIRFFIRDPSLIADNVVDRILQTQSLAELCPKNLVTELEAENQFKAEFNSAFFKDSMDHTTLCAEMVVQNCVVHWHDRERNPNYTHILMADVPAESRYSDRRPKHIMGTFTCSWAFRVRDILHFQSVMKKIGVEEYVMMVSVGSNKIHVVRICDDRYRADFVFQNWDRESEILGDLDDLSELLKLPLLDAYCDCETGRAADIEWQCGVEFDLWAREQTGEPVIRR